MQLADVFTPVKDEPIKYAILVFTTYLVADWMPLFFIFIHHRKDFIIEIDQGEQKQFETLTERYTVTDRGTIE